MDKVIDFNLEKARKHTICASAELEATGRQMGDDTLRTCKNLVDIMKLDYEESKQYAPALLEVYLCMSAVLADYCIKWYELDEPAISKNLWEIIDTLQARMK
jgi:hypothetical protein